MSLRFGPAREPRLRTEDYLARGTVLAFLLGTYFASFLPLYRLVGDVAFVVGVALCILGGALLGARGAVLVVLATTLIDRTSVFALGMEGEGLLPLVLATGTKLGLAVGMGLLVDSRRRLHATNLRLTKEVKARKRTEISLERSERLYRALVESLGEGVGVFDACDRFVFANRSLGRIMGTSPSELVGEFFSDFLGEESQEQVQRASVPDLEGSRCYEVVSKNVDSTLLLVTETTLTQSGKDGTLTLRVVRDLTERIVSERRQRDLQREIQRGQALQSLAVLAGGVAHDFNNLLGGVVGNAELALRRIPENAPAQLRSCLEEIRSFADEAADLSRQMLAYAGRRALAIETMDINAEVEDGLRLLRTTIDSQARLVLDLGANLPEVAADRSQLRQVLTNLTLNALEAMSDHRGTLTIRTDGIFLEDGRPATASRPGLVGGEYVRITVQDTGPGIPPEVRERIFEPFFSTKSPGRGMGPAAALGIVRSHRGRLEVESDPATGTSLHVLLPPATQAIQRPRETAPRSSAPPRAHHVLVIDDEPAVRLVTGRLLAELGQEVLTADRGRTGLDVFREHRDAIDLVLLDLTMPDMSGAEVLAALQEIDAKVRVVITSGFHASDASELLATPHVIGFLEKPHTLTNLEVLLASVP